MIRLLWRFRELSPLERGLVFEATFALGVAAFAIAVFRFRTIASAAGRPSSAAIDEADGARLVRQVRWAVSACARRVPWRAKCFEQGLAAQWMLSRRNVVATLHYGIAKRDDQDLIAHVWVRAGPLNVMGCEIRDDFTELARFPADQ
ncbi:MAG TPA: lasso peptide biosynthesis B2 protein [Allosphingosinicella sp.]|nr:lasso peptide biosynthesis B2 protein [Allosphingosinicella sp.]